MFKALIVAAMMVATPAVAAKKAPPPQHQSEEVPQIKTVTIPMKATCMPVEIIGEVMESNDFKVLSVSEAGEKGVRMVLFYNLPKKILVVANIIEETHVGCIMLEQHDIEFTEEGITNMFGRKA